MHPAKQSIPSNFSASVHYSGSLWTSRGGSRMSLAALEAELADFRQRCVSGLLTGALPDGFLEVFNALPDRPLEHVLRSLPPEQVVKVRGVSRKWNQLIKKASKSMPKKRRDGLVMIRVNEDGGVSFEWVGQINECGRKTTQIGADAPLSELLRFIPIDGTIFFSDLLMATDTVLEQMTKAWLSIRPQRLVFSGELKDISAHSLTAFLAKVEPFVRLLHFQNATIPENLLNDRVLAAAGRLDRLMVLPGVSWGADPPVVNVGDETLASMGSWNKMPSYMFFHGCSATVAGIRAFVEKWIKCEGAVADEEPPTGGVNVLGDELCELTFYQCPNITAEAVEDACGDLLKKEKCTADWFGGGDQQGEDQFTVAFGASHRRLCVQFHNNSRKHFIEPLMLYVDECDAYDSMHQDDDLYDPDMYDFEDDYDPEDEVDYDDYDEDTDLD